MSETGPSVLSTLSLIELNDYLSILKLPRTMQRDALAFRMKWSVWDAQEFLNKVSDQSAAEFKGMTDDELTAIAEAPFELDDALGSS
jgi:hypothetical protein